MDERKPHKWSEVIKAWADGKPIQFKIGENDWEDYDPATIQNSQSSATFFPFVVPMFDLSYVEWRVKPDDIFITAMVYLDIDNFIQLSFQDEPNLRLEFDQDTRKLVKAEVIG